MVQSEGPEFKPQHCKKKKKKKKKKKISVPMSQTVEVGFID
jgi:hypothetical protein